MSFEQSVCIGQLRSVVDWMTQAAEANEYVSDIDPDGFELQCALDNVIEAAQALATQIKLDNGVADT